MKYVSAYMLAVLGGNAKPSENDIRSILGSTGIDVDAEKVKLVIKRLSAKSIDELIAEGAKGLVSISGGGGAAPAAAAAAPAAAAPAEEKGGKKKEEPKEESDDDMGFGLFD